MEILYKAHILFLLRAWFKKFNWNNLTMAFVGNFRVMNVAIKVDRDIRSHIALLIRLEKLVSFSASNVQKRLICTTTDTGIITGNVI